MKKKVYALIPARFHSTRLPGKPLIKILGKTLIQRTFENVKKCPILEDVFVATDDENIEKHVKEFGGKVIMTSPTCKNGTERLSEALIKEPFLQDSEMIVNIQGDHPCISEDSVNSLVSALRKDKSAVMSTVVSPITDPKEALSSHVVKCVFDEHFRALYFSRSFIPYEKDLLQCKNSFYHVGIYAYTPEFLLLYPTLKNTRLQLIEFLVI